MGSQYYTQGDQKLTSREHLLSIYLAAVQNRAPEKHQPKVRQYEMVCGNGFAMPAAVITEDYKEKAR